MLFVTCKYYYFQGSVFKHTQRQTERESVCVCVCNRIKNFLEHILKLYLLNKSAHSLARFLTATNSRCCFVCSNVFLLCSRCENLFVRQSASTFLLICPYAKRQDTSSTKGQANRTSCKQGMNSLSTVADAVGSRYPIRPVQRFAALPLLLLSLLLHVSN